MTSCGSRPDGDDAGPEGERQGNKWPPPGRRNVYNIGASVVAGRLRRTEADDRWRVVSVVANLTAILLLRGLPIMPCDVPTRPTPPYFFCAAPRLPHRRKYVQSNMLHNFSPDMPIVALYKSYGSAARTSCAHILSLSTTTGPARLACVSCTPLGSASKSKSRLHGLTAPWPSQFPSTTTWPSLGALPSPADTSPLPSGPVSSFVSVAPPR